LKPAESDAVQNWVGADARDIVYVFRKLPEAVTFQNLTDEELFAGLDDNPGIIQLDTMRRWFGSDTDDMGYLPLGLALHADGGEGHDVLHMIGSRSDVHFEQLGDTIENMRLEDGAMLSLRNAGMIAFDSGENVLLAYKPGGKYTGSLISDLF